MNLGDHDLFGTRTSLVHCPRCQDRLEYAVGGEAGDKDVVIERTCPGCGYGDSVVTSSLSVAVWYRRETRILAELRPLAVFLGESPSENGRVAEWVRETA